MAKRYGRKQKRKHRAQIAQIEKHVAELMLLKQFAENKAARAEQKAFEEFLERSGLYTIAVKECARGVGIGLAEQLNEQAEKILSVVFREPPKFLYESSPMNECVKEMNVITVSIPLKTIHYRKIIA